MKKIVLTLILGIFLIGMVSAISISVCCEKQEAGGPWCMNLEEGDCDTTYRTSPTICQSTSFCKLGTCIDINQGVCMENTPQRTCTEKGGFWKEETPDEIPQCRLGCCNIGDQAAFVTQTRCKNMSKLYGLETSFRSDLTNELSCIASASPESRGACVFEKEFEKTCKMTTRKECQDMDLSASSDVLENFGSEEGSILTVTFYEDRLCTDERLETNCGPTVKTTCVEGKDEVYYVDSCGNVANIFEKNPPGDYWSRMYTKAESCGYGESNAGNSDCGNCDYYAGSTCKKKGNGNICQNLGCSYEGKDYSHGETWCAQSEGTDYIEVEDLKIQPPVIPLKEDSIKIKVEEKERTVAINIEDQQNLPGSRYHRMLCYNGDVTIEPCSDYRQEICVESKIGEFSTAACRVNRWEDCVNQEDKKDCLNEERRDCRWINSGDPVDDVSFDSHMDDLDDFWDEIRTGDIKTGGKELTTERYMKFTCVPQFPPGYDFWQNGDGVDLCQMASASCVVTYEVSNFEAVFGKLDRKKEDCIENCHCLYPGPQWAEAKMNICSAMGDCGSKVNYIRSDGYYAWEDLYTDDINAGEDIGGEDE